MRVSRPRMRWQHVYLIGAFDFEQTESQIDIDALAARYSVGHFRPSESSKRCATAPAARYTFANVPVNRGFHSASHAVCLILKVLLCEDVRAAASDVREQGGMSSRAEAAMRADDASCIRCRRCACRVGSNRACIEPRGG
jgi:hypothetical protein